MSITHT